MPSYQRIDVMFVSIYTISSCQSSSIPTYVGLSESLMVSFPDNLQLPCWRLYEIRQPPISLCTTSNFLMVAIVIMIATIMVVMLVMVVVVNRTGQDRTGQDKTGQNCC